MIFIWKRYKMFIFTINRSVNHCRSLWQRFFSSPNVNSIETITHSQALWCRSWTRLKSWSWLLDSNQTKILLKAFKCEAVWSVLRKWDNIPIMLSHLNLTFTFQTEKKHEDSFECTLFCSLRFILSVYRTNYSIRVQEEKQNNEKRVRRKEKLLEIQSLCAIFHTWMNAQKLNTYFSHNYVNKLVPLFIISHMSLIHLSLILRIS